MKTLVLAFIVAVTATPAFADVTCVANNVVGNHDSQVCGTTTIPSNSTVTTNMSCGAYNITVDCDLYNHAFKLSLAITGPNGAKSSISQNSDLYLVDSNGNGIAVHCEVSS